MRRFANSGVDINRNAHDHHTDVHTRAHAHGSAYMEPLLLSARLMNVVGNCDVTYCAYRDQGSSIGTRGGWVNFVRKIQMTGYPDRHCPPVNHMPHGDRVEDDTRIEAYE